MKRARTLFLPPLMIGVAVAIYGLSTIGHEGFGFWQWCLAIVAVLVIGLLLGGLLNLAVFAPVYWLIGRLHLRKPQTETGTEAGHENKR